MMMLWPLAVIPRVTHVGSKHCPILSKSEWCWWYITKGLGSGNMILGHEVEWGEDHPRKHCQDIPTMSKLTIFGIDLSQLYIFAVDSQLYTHWYFKFWWTVDWRSDSRQTNQISQINKLTSYHHTASPWQWNSTIKLSLFAVSQNPNYIFIWNKFTCSTTCMEQTN